MNRRAICKPATMLLMLFLVSGAGCSHLQESGTRDHASGYYEGNWYGPNPDRPLGELTCTIVPRGDETWHATFFATFGGVGEYEVALEGRRDGESVKFEGAVDLGATSGGVFDWHGEIVGNDFNGSYTSQGISGTFRMVRAPKPSSSDTE